MAEYSYVIKVMYGEMNMNIENRRGQNTSEIENYMCIIF